MPDIWQAVHEQGPEEHRQDAKPSDLRIETTKEIEAIQDSSEQLPPHKDRRLPVRPLILFIVIHPSTLLNKAYNQLTSPFLYLFISCVLFFSYSWSSSTFMFSQTFYCKRPSSIPPLAEVAFDMLLTPGLLGFVAPFSLYLSFWWLKNLLSMLHFWT